MTLKNKEMELNFNALAWNAPEHDGEYGYLPTDEYYTEICSWLRSLDTRYKTRTGNVTTVRKSQRNCIWDVIVTYNHETKMISWIFRKCYEYAA